jgi:hypothetical protein
MISWKIELFFNEFTFRLFSTFFREEWLLENPGFEKRFITSTSLVVF